MAHRPAAKPVQVGSLVRPAKRPAGLPGRGRFAAVMILLFKRLGSDAIRFVLTRRREDLKHHPGQISLPGGSVEGDESLREAAVRETEEEIGVAAEQIEVLGRLTDVYIPPSDFMISPFVGWYAGRPEFTPQESEVAAVIEADLNWMCHSETLRFGEIDGTKDETGRAIRSHYFQLDSHQVWGATAKVLLDFRSRLFAAMESR